MENSSLPSLPHHRSSSTNCNGIGIEHSSTLSNALPSIVSKLNTSLLKDQDSVSISFVDQRPSARNTSEFFSPHELHSSSPLSDLHINIRAVIDQRSPRISLSSKVKELEKEWSLEYLAAAKQGHFEAILFVAESFEKGFGSIPVNLEKSRFWYSQLDSFYQSSQSVALCETELPTSAHSENVLNDRSDRWSSFGEENEVEKKRAKPSIFDSISLAFECRMHGPALHHLIKLKSSLHSPFPPRSVVQQIYAK